MKFSTALTVLALVFSVVQVSAQEIIAPTAVVVPAPPPTVVTIFGDLRQRFEHIENENPSAGKSKSYDLNRLRARLGVKAKPVADVNVEVRLATGYGGTSTNQSYGADTQTGMRNYDFRIDRGYFKWTPKYDVAITMGRMANPFVAVSDSDLIFDGDLNFDGTAVSWQKKFENLEILAAVGSFTLAETKDAAGVDITMQSAQLGARTKIADKYSVGLMVSHHTFNNMQGHAAIVNTPAANFNNNSNNGTVYTYSYETLVPGLEFGFDMGLPVTLFYEMVENSRVNSENKGSIYGVKVNKAKIAGDWQLTIDQRELERDATVGAFSDSDSFGGGTNGRSLRVAAQYMVSDAMNVSVTDYMGEVNIASGQSSADRNRLHFDLGVKF